MPGTSVWPPHELGSAVGGLSRKRCGRGWCSRVRRWACRRCSIACCSAAAVIGPVGRPSFVNPGMVGAAGKEAGEEGWCGSGLVLSVLYGFMSVLWGDRLGCGL